jgi:signal transduction histidine kinase
MSEALGIAVVEDDQGLNELICRRLVKDGHKCRGFFRAAELFAWLEKNTPDLIVLDLVLPDCSGAALMSRIEGLGRRIPFIAATGQGSEAVAVKALKMGARDYLVKNSEFLDALPAVVDNVWREVQLETMLSKAREKIAVQNAILSAVHEASPQGILAAGADGKIILHNKPLLGILGVTAAQTEGRSAADFFRDNAAKFSGAARSPENFAAPAADGVICDDLKINGRIFDLYTCSLKGDDGRGRGRVWCFRDITVHAEAREAMRLAKEQAELNAEERGRLFALITHDLKTPINAVSGFASLLEKTELSGKQREYTGIIKSSGAHILDLVNDILDLTRLENGAMEFFTQPLSFHSTVRECAMICAPAAQENGTELAVDIAPETPDIINGDSALIRRLILNIVGNAVKFTRKGSARIHCRPGPAGFIEVSVSDTGAGIDPRYHEDIFKPFNRGEGGLPGKAAGSGLGLTVARQIVAAWGGSMTVKSVPGEGSVFTFTVPLDFKPEPRGA